MFLSPTQQEEQGTVTDESADEIAYDSKKQFVLVLKPHL